MGVWGWHYTVAHSRQPQLLQLLCLWLGCLLFGAALPLPLPPAAAAVSLQDSRSRPTAKYLQQHKFACREQAATAAVKALLPLVQQARTHMAELALMAGIEAQQAGPAGVADDGAFSWRDPRSTLAPSPAGGAPYVPVYGASSGTLVAQQQQQPAAYQQTVAAAGTPHMLRASADGGGMFGGSPAGLAAGGEPSGTFVVRGPAASSSGGGGGGEWGSTVIVSPAAAAGPPSSRARHAGALPAVLCCAVLDTSCMRAGRDG